MHKTVRLLKELGAVPTCPSLSGSKVKRLGPAHPWIWTLELNRDSWWVRRRILTKPGSAEPPSTYEVLEENMSKNEIKLLTRWLDSELEVLQNDAIETTGDPRTLIGQLRVWLWGQVSDT
jgi:hypothetical protein